MSVPAPGTGPLPLPATHMVQSLGGREGERAGAASGGVPPEISVLTRRSDFLAANKGLRVARPGFVLLANANGGQGLRYGITVTKRIGNAVVRNRMKRRFRALLRELLPVQGIPDTDHVLIGREGGIERGFAMLREELVAALDRARAGKGDKPRIRKSRP